MGVSSVRVHVDPLGLVTQPGMVFLRIYSGYELGLLKRGD